MISRARGSLCGRSMKLIEVQRSNVLHWSLWNAVQFNRCLSVAACFSTPRPAKSCLCSLCSATRATAGPAWGIAQRMHWTKCSCTISHTENPRSKQVCYCDFLCSLCLYTFSQYLSRVRSKASVSSRTYSVYMCVSDFFGCLHCWSPSRSSPVCIDQGKGMGAPNPAALGMRAAQCRTHQFADGTIVF